ncbi:MAG: 2-amino-4-hydroxy-6-hydroxymethyldihydropteridine diphosphokinase [Anaerolineales bacterium]|nr:2-amino-4-hydroxy-6-hydroxymethyldihydropteridine diphosphokinase [Anaerolineales bacterium]
MSTVLSKQTARQERAILRPSPSAQSLPAAPVDVILLLGSNIQPEHNLRRAIALLDRWFGLLGVSAVWETPPVGSQGPNFLNVAVRLRTALDPQHLKEAVLRPLERSLGRVRTADKYAPRPIDIDIVLWGDQAIDDDLWRYAHTAIPIAELLPDLRREPGGETLAQVAQRLSRQTPIRQHSKVTP